MKYNDLENKLYKINSENYENIFNIYFDENDQYYYNLLKKVDFPSDLDATLFTYYETKPKDAYTNISYKFYGSVVLWWLICATNGIDDPTKQPEVGTLLKIIQPFYVKTILTKLQQKDI